MNLIKRLLKEEDGQGMIEYALIAALISIIAIAVIILAGDSIKVIWQNIGNELTKAETAPTT